MDINEAKGEIKYLESKIKSIEEDIKGGRERQFRLRKAIEKYQIEHKLGAYQLKQG